jgi:hypothetical protein
MDVVALKRKSGVSNLTGFGTDDHIGDDGVALSVDVGHTAGFQRQFDLKHGGLALFAHFSVRADFL